MHHRFGQDGIDTQVRCRRGAVTTSSDASLASHTTISPTALSTCAAASRALRLTSGGATGPSLPPPRMRGDSAWHAGSGRVPRRTRTQERAMRIPAATEITMGRVSARSGFRGASSRRDLLRFDGDDNHGAACDRRRERLRMRPPQNHASGSLSPSGDTSATRMSSGSIPRRKRALISARPMLPPPAIATD